MAFSYDLAVDNEDLNIKLIGRLDAVNAPTLMNEFTKLIGTPIKKIIFDAKELEYIASAGLRVILMAKQKFGTDTEVLMKNTQDDVASILETSGFNTFVQFIGD